MTHESRAISVRKQKTIRGEAWLPKQFTTISRVRLKIVKVKASNDL